MIRFLKKVWIFKITNFRPFCFNHNYRNGKRHNENLTAVSASLRLFARFPQHSPAARCLSSDFYHFGGENLTRFKIAAQTLMIFAGNFFTREMERQTRYNVVQILVKTMTWEPRQRYLKVKCTVPNKIDGRITVGMNGFISSRCYTFVQTDIFFCHLSKDTTIAPFL